MLIRTFRKCVAIASIAAAVSLTAPGFALAVNDPPQTCPVDIVCEARYWDGLNSQWECDQRYHYCMGINRCWHHGWNKLAADSYRDNVIIPSHNRCMERNAAQ